MLFLNQFLNSTAGADLTYKHAGSVLTDTSSETGCKEDWNSIHTPRQSTPWQCATLNVQRGKDTFYYSAWTPTDHSWSLSTINFSGKDWSALSTNNGIKNSIQRKGDGYLHLGFESKISMGKFIEMTSCALEIQIRITWDKILGGNSSWLIFKKFCSKDSISVYGIS